MPAPNQGDHAMVLAGGGAYAAYEVGVMSALLTGQSPATEGIPVDPKSYAGTSGGAFNAALMTAYGDLAPKNAIEALEAAWMTKVSGAHALGESGIFRLRANPLSFADANPVQTLENFASDAAFLTRDWLGRAAAFATSAASVEERSIELFDFSSLVDTAPFEKTLQDIMPYGGIPLSPRRLYVTATGWNTGRLRVFQNADFDRDEPWRILAASAAIPGFFPPVDLDGATYVDGSVLLKTPLKSSIRGGSETLHVIYMDPDISNVPISALSSTLSTYERMMLIQSAAALNRDISKAARVNREIDLTRGAGVLSRRITTEIERMDPSVDPSRLTIHLYHPSEDLGGSIGLLNFERSHVQSLIEKGFQDAVQHDCLACGCIPPSGVPNNPASPAFF